MPAPIKHTCPDIDKLQRRVKVCIKAIKDVVEDERTKRDIVWDLETISDEMEELRNANAALRDWGEELEKELRDKEDDLFELEQELQNTKQSA